MSNLLLIITNSPNSRWSMDLTDALKSLFQVKTITEMELEEAVSMPVCSLIVVDAAYVSDAASLVSTLRGGNSEVPIVVVTASPTWNQAREAFLAGASDYIYKTAEASKLTPVLERFV